MDVFAFSLIGRSSHSLTFAYPPARFAILPVCENYNPGFVANNKGVDCTGDHFYHWGGLTSFVSLLEAGHY